MRGGGEVRPIIYGVIQGSLLGPIMFPIFTNDLPSYLNTKVVLYADDVQLLHLAPPKSVLELNLKSDYSVRKTSQITGNSKLSQDQSYVLRLFYSSTRSLLEIRDVSVTFS